MENDPLPSMNAISSTINEREQILWEKEAFIKSTKAICNNLDQEISAIEISIANSEKDIANVSSEIEQLNYCYDVLKDSIQLDITSSINENLYKKCLENNIIEYKKNISNVIEEYIQYARDEEERLRAENPQYCELEMKKNQLKCDNIIIRDLKKKIDQQKQKNALKFEIATKLFRSNVIIFAENWLLQKEFDDTVDQLKVAKQKEICSLKELLEVQEMVKMQYKKYYSLSPNLLNLKIQNSIQEKKDSLNSYKNNQLTNANSSIIQQELHFKNSFLEMDSKNLEKLNCVLNQSDRSLDTIRKEFSVNHDKVRIVDDVVIKPPPPPSSQNKPIRINKITQKFQSFVKQLSRSSSIESLTKKSQKSHVSHAQNSHPVNNNCSKTIQNQSADIGSSESKQLEQSKEQSEAFRQELFNQYQQDVSSNAKALAFIQQNQHFNTTGVYDMENNLNRQHLQTVPVQNNPNIINEKQKMFFSEAHRMPQFLFMNGANEKEEQLQTMNGNNNQVEHQSQFICKNLQSTPQQQILSSFFSQPRKLPLQSQFETRQMSTVPFNRGDGSDLFYGHSNTRQETVIKGPADYGNFDESIDAECQPGQNFFDSSLDQADTEDGCFPAPQFSPEANSANDSVVNNFLPIQQRNNNSFQPSFTFGQSNNNMTNMFP